MDRGIFYINILMLVIGLICFFYIAAVVPESPKWLFSRFKFNYAREDLAFVGKFNGLQRK
jgi:hypothetical protein